MRWMPTTFNILVLDAVETVDVFDKVMNLANEFVSVVFAAFGAIAIEKMIMLELAPAQVQVSIKLLDSELNSWILMQSILDQSFHTIFTRSKFDNVSDKGIESKAPVELS